MKALILCCFILFTTSAYAQVIIDDVNINDLEKVNYISVTCDFQFVLEKINIKVDYGQNRFRPLENQIIKNKNQEKVKFVSVMHVLNFFDNNGWDLVQKETIRKNKKLLDVFLLRKEL